MYKFKKSAKQVTATTNVNNSLNYMREKDRMCSSYIKSCNDCLESECPLKVTQNGITITCRRFESLYLEQAIEIVQKWSDEHPQKTYLTNLLEKYPNIPLDNNGKPSCVCPHDLGLMSIEDCKKDSNKCVECWNQPVSVEDGEE
jgi:hypothetical protein